MAPSQQKLTKDISSKIEQRTLKISFYTLIFVAFGSLSYGLIIRSDVVILNGVFSMISLMGSWLNLLAAKLVNKPADRNFQFGYWHVEPLILSVNSLMMTIICIYAILNGIENLRSGGNIVDGLAVISFAIATGIICGVFGLYEWIASKRIKSEILAMDAREWLMDFAFSLVTLIGFSGLFILNDPYLSFWKKYADSIMVISMAAFLLPFPLLSFIKNVRQVLRITNTQEALVIRVEFAMQQIKEKHEIQNYTTHILKVGRTYFVEINILAGANFGPQTIREQDKLREEIWKACDKPLDDLWLSVCITADPRWT